MKDLTINTKWLAMLSEGAKSRGLDCAKIMLKHGISSISVKQQSSRVPLDAFAAFADELIITLGDEYMGLAEKPQKLGSFHIISRAAISTRTLGHSLKCTAQYWNLFDNSYRHEVKTENDTSLYMLHKKPNFEPINNYLVSSILSSIHRFHCWVGGQFLALEEVRLDHPRPNFHDEYDPLFYGAPVRFESQYAAIRFPSRYLDTPISQTPETLHEYLKGTNFSLLYQPKNYRILSDQVRQWLERNIKQGNYRVTLREASEHFKLSQQVMHRRLSAENVSFKDIKKETRRDIAIRLLFEDRYKVEDIAIMVGFSEPSAFIRAFKSWTGKTPRTYRQSQLNDENNFT